MNLRIEGDKDLARDLSRAPAALAQEFTKTTQRIGEEVARVLPTNSDGGATEIPTRRLGPHLIELWGPNVHPGQEPRPFISPSQLGELPDIEALYADGVERVLRKISD